MMKQNNCKRTIFLALLFFFIMSFATLMNSESLQAKKATGKWVKVEQGYKYRYKNGTFAKSKWINKYYVDKNGLRKASGWLIVKKKTYYISKKDSKRVTGFKKIDKKKYYFRSDGTMAQNCTIKKNDKYYYFRQNGTYKTMPCYIKIIDSDGRVCTLHREYASDPQIGIDITEEDLLTATVYTEANIHGKVGMTAVGLVVLNRMSSGKFPADLAICVYSRVQFQIARNGALTTALKNIANHRHTSAYKTARSAAKQAMKIYKNHRKKGTPRKIPGLKMPSGKKDFDYLFFMTTGSFKKLGLDRVRCGDAVSYKPKNVRCSAHVFFKRWAYKK